MRSRGLGIVAASAWAVTGALGLAGCWDTASLEVTTAGLTAQDAGAGGDASGSGDGTAGCVAPFTLCGAACVDTFNDPTHCGGCGGTCVPPPPACIGGVATAFGPGACNAGACAFPEATIDCEAQKRQCAGAQCTACIAGYQDNDLNGSCTPNCATAGLTCSGNGACSDTTGSAACVCNPGFSGPVCATNINDCLGMPCLNGAACVDVVGGYTCTCVPGFSGANCQTNIDDCVGAPCVNGGVCVDGINSHTCNCPLGFAGANCETNIDDCAGAPCLNGGMCVDGVNTYTCNCAPGFAGPNCATLVPTFLWLDATDPTTLTKDGANNVTQWRDKSGLARHASIPVGSAAPVWTDAVVNALPAISFNGSTVRLQTAAVPTSAEMTIFVVFNMVSPQTWGSLVNQAHDTYFSIRKSDCCGGGGNLNFHIENDNAAPLQPITLNTWKVVTALRQGTTSTLYYTQASATSFVGDTLTGGASVPITIGNAISVSESMGGYISEIRAFNTALDAASRAGVESVLKAKYAIP